MSKLQLRAFLYQLGCFAILFVLFRYLVFRFTDWSGFLGSFAAFLAATTLSPKFQAVRTKDGEKLFMKIIFSKNVKQIG